MGYPPFSEEITAYSLRDQIVNARYSFHEQYWKGVSRDAKDMVSSLLTLDPGSRITVSEALLHPWLRDKEVVGRAEKLMAEADAVPSPILTPDSGPSPVQTPVIVSLYPYTSLVPRPSP